MTLKEKAKLIQTASEQIAHFKAVEDKIYNRLQKALGIDDSDSVVFDYLFNGPGPGSETATKVAKLAD